MAETAVRDFDLDFLGSEFTGIEVERFELTFGSGSSVGMEGRHIDDVQVVMFRCRQEMELKRVLKIS